MATRTATVGSPPRIRTKQFTWSGLASATGDAGNAVDVLGYSSLLITSQLTSGTAVAVRLQGSHDGTNWFPLTSDTTPGGTTALSTVTQISLTAFPRFVRPSYAASSGNCVAVITMLCKG